MNNQSHCRYTPLIEKVHKSGYFDPELMDVLNHMETMCPHCLPEYKRVFMGYENIPAPVFEDKKVVEQKIINAPEVPSKTRKCLDVAAGIVGTFALGLMYRIGQEKWKN